jgi:hypothetical protein
MTFTIATLKFSALLHKLFQAGSILHFAIHINIKVKILAIYYYSLGVDFVVHFRAVKLNLYKHRTGSAFRGGVDSGRRDVMLWARENGTGGIEWVLLMRLLGQAPYRPCNGLERITVHERISHMHTFCQTQWQKSDRGMVYPEWMPANHI